MGIVIMKRGMMELMIRGCSWPYNLDVRTLFWIFCKRFGWECRIFTQIFQWLKSRLCKLFPFGMYEWHFVGYFWFRMNYIQDIITCTCHFWWYNFTRIGRYIRIYVVFPPEQYFHSDSFNILCKWLISMILLDTSKLHCQIPKHCKNYVMICTIFIRCDSSSYPSLLSGSMIDSFGDSYRIYQACELVSWYAHSWSL